MGLNVLSAIHGMSAIWDVRYWEVSLYLQNLYIQKQSSRGVFKNFANFIRKDMCRSLFSNQTATL